MFARTRALGAQRCLRMGIIVIGLLALLSGRAMGDPVCGKEYDLRQPDGTSVRVRIWGDEYYRVVETLDGYSVSQDPKTGYVCYTQPSADGSAMRSTGIPVGKALPTTLGLSPHIRLNSQMIAAQIRGAKASAAGLQIQAAAAGAVPLAAAAPSGLNEGTVQAAPAPAPTVRGLCLLVDFPDVPATISQAEIDNYWNQPGYTNYGNNGSVRDFFYDISWGHLTYTNYVTAYYRALHPTSYYNDPNVGYPIRAQELIREALTALVNAGMDLTTFDGNGDHYIDALNCLYAGNRPGTWSAGLWPHQSWMSFSAPGIYGAAYEMTDISSSLSIGTVCHENGHLVCNWPDLYDYSGNGSWPGVGNWCLMASANFDKNPAHPCAYLKVLAGWATTTPLTSAPSTVSVTAGNSTFYTYGHPGHANEYFIIENRQKTGRDANLPGSGVLIWHVDTYGSQTYHQRTPTQHYLVSLEQADGRYDLENNVNGGNATDAWRTGGTFSTLSTPDSKWWSGELSGLTISNISASGQTMTFTQRLSGPGTLAAWGRNDAGQLGDGTTTQQNTFEPLSSVTGVVATAEGNAHSLALKADGTVWAWGANDAGQLGDGTTTPHSSPAQVPGLTGVQAIAAGSAYNLALKSDGIVWAWGANSAGQLGDGTTTQQNTPVQVAGLSNVIAIAAGADRSLALKSDGTVWAWGANDFGQIGNGTTTAQPSAVQVSGLSGVVAIASGQYHGLAIKSDGTVWAWGANDAGQIGDGTATNRSAPVQVSSLATMVALAAGRYHSLALRADGTVWAWGANDHGQLGDGTTISHSSPVQLTSLAGMVAVAAGAAHSLALKSDKTVWAWGSNTYGQLGDSTTAEHSTPSQVSGLTCVEALSSGGWHNLAVQRLNLAPVVEAGPDQTVILGGLMAQMAGTATDDGLPNPPGAMTYSWSQVSGPGTATFMKGNTLTASAYFTAVGTYVLKLTVTDGDLNSTDTMSVTVLPFNLPPTVNAGPDQIVIFPAPASLVGTASDDGLPDPPAALTYTWSTVSGPGTVTFTDPAALATTATFSDPGTYVLQLLASDSELSWTDTVTIYVHPHDDPPVIDAGPDQTITLPAVATLAAAATDDGLPNPPAALTYTWSKVSGPGAVTFGDAHALVTTAGATVGGSYVLQLQVYDGELTVTDTMNLTILLRLGDVDGDGQINLADLKLLVVAWNSMGGGAYGNWNANADLDKDNYVGLSDLKILIANWNR